jgi:hypothetical protein
VSILKAPWLLFSIIYWFGLVGKLRAILEYDDLKPEVFQGYREIGNIIAFVKDLSELLDVQEQLRFVSVAPLLGLAPDAVEAPATTAAPLGAVLQRLSESLATTIDNVGSSNAGPIGSSNAGPNASSSAAPTGGVSNTLQALQSSPHHRVYNSALTVIQLPEIAGKLVSSLASGIQTKSLLSYFMGKMDEAFFQFNLTEEWGFKCSPEGAVDLNNESIGDDNNSAFHRLFSALNFLFCVFESQPEPTTDERGQVEEQDIIVPDDDEFGHGFAIAGILFLHLLGQRAIFELSDFSYFVLNVYNHDKRVVVNDGSVGNVDSELFAETSRFVTNAIAQRNVHLELFSYFEMQIPRPNKHNIRFNTTNGSTNGEGNDQQKVLQSVMNSIVKLHPPADA